MDDKKNESVAQKSMREWQEFVASLEEELGKTILEKWMPKCIHFDAANIYLEAKDSFQINWFEEHVRPKIKHLTNQNQRPIRVHIEKEGQKEAKKDHREQKEFSISQDPIDPQMTFENFIPSSENLVVYKILTEDSPFILSALQKFEKCQGGALNLSQAKPGAEAAKLREFSDTGGSQIQRLPDAGRFTLLECAQYNPIYIYGPKSVGKTHLLMATANFYQSQGKRVFFVDATSFTDHVVQAIRLGEMQAFRKVYREIDLLLIDNIEVFSKKSATQEEFFHTFNTLHTMGKPIILSANVPPSKLYEIEPRLISRFEWGISLELVQSEVHSILKSKAKLWNFSLSDALRTWLVESFPKDPVMALQALIIRSKGVTPSHILAEKLLKDLLQKRKRGSSNPYKNHQNGRKFLWNYKRRYFGKITSQIGRSSTKSGHVLLPRTFKKPFSNHRENFR